MPARCIRPMSRGAVFRFDCFGANCVLQPRHGDLWARTLIAGASMRIRTRQRGCRRTQSANAADRAADDARPCVRSTDVQRDPTRSMSESRMLGALLRRRSVSSPPFQSRASRGRPEPGRPRDRLRTPARRRSNASNQHADRAWHALRPHRPLLGRPLAGMAAIGCGEDRYFARRVFPPDAAAAEKCFNYFSAEARKLPSGARQPDNSLVGVKEAAPEWPSRPASS